MVGELFGDPHMVTATTLRERAESAGLSVERMLGGRSGTSRGCRPDCSRAPTFRPSSRPAWASMLYAILICTDEACAEEFEAWGEPYEFDDMLCEGCGCTLQAVAFSEARAETSVTRLPRFTPHLQLRAAA